MEVHVEIAAETLFEIGPLGVTNSMLTMFVVMGLILLGGWLLARKLTMVPSRKQGAVEGIVEFLLGLVESSGGKTAGRRIFPLIGAIFIFIALSNYSGLLPGVGTIGFYHEVEEETDDGEGNVVEGEVDAGGGESSTEVDSPSQVEPTTETSGEEEGAVYRELASTDAASLGAGTSGDGDARLAAKEGEKVLVPYLRAPNADLNMTLALALVTFTAVQILGIQTHGVRGRIKHMADPPFLLPIELISEFSRIISLSARLFGNVFAGEVLLGVMYAMAAAIKIAIIPVLFPVAFLFLELLFGTIQALVFSLLTLIYITLATSGGHEDHAHADQHAPAPGGVRPASPLPGHAN